MIKNKIGIYYSMISDIISQICKYLDFCDKIKFLKINKNINRIALHSINKLPIYLYKYLTDEKLKLFPYLRKLKLVKNTKITRNGIKLLKLKQLDCYGNRINDNDIMNMKGLRTLILRRNQKITNFSLKFLNLKRLCIIGNRNITYDGIKHMKLDELAVMAVNINDIGLKNMKLQTLYIDNNITDNDICHMKLKYSTICGNNKITIDGIKKMKLKLLGVEKSIRWDSQKPNINLDLTKITNIETIDIDTAFHLRSEIVEKIKENGYSYISGSDNHIFKKIFI